MSEYSSVHYKNNFLKHVIVRIDFHHFVPTSSTFNESIEKEILKIFPRREKDQIIHFNSVNMVFNSNSNNSVNAKNEFQEGLQKEYLTNDGSSKLILTNKFIIFEINKYTSFEEHERWFQSILFTFFKENRVSVSRTGIRYVNIFDSSKIKLQKKLN